MALSYSLHRLPHKELHHNREEQVNPEVIQVRRQVLTLRNVLNAQLTRGHP